MGLCFTKQSDKDDSMSSNKGWCSYSDFERRVYPIIDNLSLSPFKKNIIRKRYVKLVLIYENQYDITHYRYNLCRILISIGSMILPTLQTIQNNENVASIKDEIFWGAIGTSLTVMVCNNIISMFTLDRRYIMYAVTSERLKSVGWQYFEESGMFANSSHLLNYTKFWNEIEKTIKLQIMSEFNADDKHSKDDEFEDRGINGNEITYNNIDLTDNPNESHKQPFQQQQSQSFQQQQSQSFQQQQSQPFQQQQSQSFQQQPFQKQQTQPFQKQQSQPFQQQSFQEQQEAQELFHQQEIQRQQESQKKFQEQFPKSSQEFKESLDEPFQQLEKEIKDNLEEFNINNIDKSLNPLSTELDEKFDIENQIITSITKDVDNSTNTEIILENMQEEIIDKKNV